MADFGGNFKELCRLCASFDAIKMDIFGERGKERKLLDKIHTCLPLKVSEEDLLPKSLCYRCIYNLENFYDFRKGCVDAVSRLESYVNETWGNALELQYKPQKKVKEEQEVEINSVLSVRSEYSDSQEAPNPADFLEACMDNVPIHSSSPQYEQSARYEQEQVIEVNAGSFVCPSCPQSFNNMSALILHSKCHLGGGTLTMTGKKEAVRLFTCPVCDKTFVSKGNLSNHIKVHSSEGYTPVQDRPFRCELCSKSYTVAKHLWGHVSTAHRGDPRVTCQHCLRIFSTSQNLDDHCKTKHTTEYESRFEQTVSTNEESTRAELNSSEVLNQPMNEELSNSRRKSSNPRKINREQSVDTEQSNHSINEEADSPEEENSISCLLCGRIFENRNDLRKHILVGHGIDPAEVGYPDMEMDELSIQREQMDESEMAESMLEAETVFCCEVCIREFNDRASLWLHMLYSHREEAATACGICLRVCSDNVSLLEHVDSCHPRDTMVTDKRRYSCQICARQHDSRKKLLAHVKIHNLRDADGRALDPESMVVLNSDFYGPDAPPSNEGVMDDEFSMSCEICYKSFPTELKLIKHKRNAHKESEAMHSLNSSATYKLFFPCEMCGLSHSTRTERWRHVFSYHADEPSLVCEQKGCGKVFPTRALKLDHASSHHDLQGESPNTCEICGKLWASRMNYWKHMMGVHSDCLPFICGVCLKVFCNVTDLAAHVKENHYPLDNSTEYCCDICGRPYSKKSKMSRHRKIHNLPSTEGGLEDGLFEVQPEAAERVSELGALKCDECPTEKFIDLEELSEHRRSAHNLVPCDLCPKFYGRTSHLWKHVYKIHKTHPDITCNICLKTSASKAHLAKHYSKHHREHAPPEDSSYVSWHDAVSNTGEAHNCSKCNKVFRKDHLMKQHLKHCTGPRAPSTVEGTTPAVNGSFPCEKCSRLFDTQGLLRKHVKTSHIMYTCEICDVAKDSRTELFIHIKTNHNNHPELTCDVTSCQKMLRVKKDCLKHKREHRQGYPPPTCDFCGELVQNKIKLRKHLRSTHADKTKYMCAICTESHLKYEDLQEHIKETHPSSIGKPNTCAICARKCPTKYKLETHLKTHGSEFFNCSTCFEVFTNEELFNKHCEIHPPKKLNSSTSQVIRKDSDAESGDEESGLKRKLSSENQNDEKKMRLAFNCLSCNSSFALKHELSKHQLKEHLDLRCDACNTFQDSEDALASHKNTCSPTEGRVKRKSTLISSIFDKSIERALKFESDDEFCPTNISSANSLDENSSSSKETWFSPSKHSGTRKVYENDNIYSPCEHCEKNFPAKRILWQHLIRSHRVQAATTCGVCLKFCESYYNLDTHLVEVHPQNFETEDSNSTCRVCGRYHNARSKLLLHASIHVDEEERASVLQYDCSICDMTFSSRGFLCKHEKEKHNRNTQENYIGQVTHSDENPFGDGICSDDDDSQFEGFPVEISVPLISSEKANHFECKEVLQAEEFSPKAATNSVASSSEVEDILDRSCDAEDAELDQSVVNSSEHVELDSSNTNSVCKDNFGDSEELFKQNDESRQFSSDLEREGDESMDYVPNIKTNECVNHESNVNNDESVNRETNVNNDESVNHEANVNNDKSIKFDSNVNNDENKSVHLEDCVPHSNIINSVKTFQSVSGLNQCSMRSVSLEENILEIPFTNDTNTFISQSLTDTEIDNFVT